jgi:hypothetical protein
MKKLCTGEIPNTYENVIKLNNGREIPVKWSAFKAINKQMLYGIIQNPTNGTKSSNKK